MEAEDPESRRSSKRSRLPNPLNVIVERVGATRAMVHGDVSVESLKELLMSSMSLLPTTKLGNDDEEQGSGLGFAGMSDKIKDEKLDGDKTKKKIDTGKKKIRADVSGKTDGKKKSKNLLEDGKELFGTIGDSEEDQGNEEGEEEEEDASCLSVFGTEEAPFSSNARWLRKHFGKALVQGLKDVVKKKPQDPVGYLAFWLRKYRSEEEARQRRKELDDELRRKRSSIMRQTTGPEKPVENVEPEYGSDEEGGGNADWNFNNYYPGSETAE